MKQLHLVCNAHLDPVWQWRWPEGLGAALSTFRVAADFCEEYDNFVFCHNEALLYEWTEENDPVLFERIKKLVKIGKWKIMGGWYLQPDCNMPSGESIVRQIQYGHDYFKTKFGVETDTALNLDSFGHSKGLVQIMQKAGYSAYVVMRPDAGRGLLEDLPQYFLWEGYADSKIKGFRLNASYNTLKTHADEAIEAYISAHENDGHETQMRLWGIGDHGGGPSRVDVEKVNSLIEKYRGNIELLHSSPEEFMKTIDADELPVFTRSINPIDAGCYTSMHHVKQLHRRLEAKLMTAEKAAAFCDMAGIYRYPSEKLNDAWKDLLFCEFHDILPGTSVQPAENDCMQRLCHGIEEADRIITGCLYSLARYEQPPADGDIPILVLNPHPYPVKGVFDCEFMLADQNWSSCFTAGTVYKDDTPLPSQMEKEYSNMNLDWRKHVVFSAELSPMSLNRFNCRLFTLPKKPFDITDLTAGDEYTFDNGCFRCIFDTKNGTIKSLTRSGTEYVRPGFGKLEIYEDDCDPWTEGRCRIDTPRGNDCFTLMSREEAGAYASCDIPEISPMRIIEDGDVRTVIEVLLEYRRSRARILYLLPKDGCDIRIEITLHNNEHDTMVRIAMPHNITDAVYTGQDMFGSKKLTVEYENVCQRWLMASGSGKAVAILNESTYGSLIRNDSVNLSLLRSPNYTGHKLGDRPILPLERYYPRMDQGEHSFTLDILFGDEKEITDITDIKSQIFNEPPVAVSAFGGGYEKNDFPHIEITGARLDTCRKSKDGNGYILRIFNYMNTEQTARISIDILGTDAEFLLKGSEVKSVYAAKGICRETGLIED